MSCSCFSSHTNSMTMADPNPAKHVNFSVGMVLGVMPITGIPLPFVTHGGASLVSLAAGLGILQSINIRQTRAAW